jgi:hypothetical protein
VTPAAAAATARKPTPPACAFPVGGKTPCGAEGVAQVPWSALYGYADRTGSLPLCAMHAPRFPDAAPL